MIECTTSSGRRERTILSLWVGREEERGEGRGERGEGRGERGEGRGERGEVYIVGKYSMRMYYVIFNTCRNDSCQHCHSDNCLCLSVSQ